MKLGLFLSYYQLTDAEFAHILGVSRSLISRYRSGGRIPGRAIMRQIYRTTGGLVAPNDFYDLPPLPENARSQLRRRYLGRRRD